MYDRCPFHERGDQSSERYTLVCTKLPAGYELVQAAGCTDKPDTWEAFFAPSKWVEFTKGRKFKIVRGSTVGLEWRDSTGKVIQTGDWDKKNFVLIRTIKPA